MESATMTSGDTGRVIPHTLIERLRDAEFPDYLYVKQGDQYISVYWYDDNTLKSSRIGDPAFDNPFKQFLADHLMASTEIEYRDTPVDGPLHD